MEPLRTRLSGPVLDAADAVALAHSYSALLGWPVADEDVGAEGSWAVIRSPSGHLKIEFQGLPDYERPVWPNAAHEQQMMMHLDIAVDDLDRAVERAQQLGATLANHQPRPGNRVMLDPAGHPFCLFPGAVD